MFPFKDVNPTSTFPALTLALIAANVLVYFLFQEGTLSLADPSDAAYLCNVAEHGAIPREFTEPGYERGSCDGDPASRWLSPLTSMFMHGGLLHLAGNLLFLWVFGNNIEDALGRARFLAFYLLGGLCALAAQVAIDPGSEVPTIGASGAIAAVLGGYIVLYPRARVWTLVVIVPLPVRAWIVLGLWFVEQLAFAWLDVSDPTGGGSGVAFFAHIGGFVFGLLAIRRFRTT